MLTIVSYDCPFLTYSVFHNRKTVECCVQTPSNSLNCFEITLERIKTNDDVQFRGKYGRETKKKTSINWQRRLMSYELDIYTVFPPTAKSILEWRSFVRCGLQARQLSIGGGVKNEYCTCPWTRICFAAQFCALHEDRLKDTIERVATR